MVECAAKVYCLLLASTKMSVGGAIGVALLATAILISISLHKIEEGKAYLRKIRML